jgi:hypothetical protein
VKRLGKSRAAFVVDTRGPDSTWREIHDILLFALFWLKLLLRRILGFVTKAAQSNLRLSNAVKDTIVLAVELLNLRLQVGTQKQLWYQAATNIGSAVGATRSRENSVPSLNMA